MMTRRNALLRLRENLLARRERLGKKLAGEQAYLHDWNAADTARDSADLAFEADSDEMSSRLAGLGDRELSQIERALARWERGMYGICEGGSWSCQRKIPVARLNALPYTLFCINCEREMERRLHGLGGRSTGNWGQVSDAQAIMHDERMIISEMERELSADGIR
jgi:DnaK suppressor protein